nr:hypothetical protein CFP56_03187 [Quercus suber]
MHHLVQDASQMWLEDHSKSPQVLGHLVHSLAGLFPTGDFENCAVCRVLSPRTRGSLEYKPKTRVTQLESASLIHKCAWLMREQGSHTGALAMASASVNSRLEQLGEDSE